ncbi:TM1802 family CRISPR-associated protein [Thiospirillum jenense]|uniref:CRISPR-associated protein n=1 Tax=Thiospirillum jenense TaxID=1653858 RepID=A0A839HCM6_9GAMM|nr:TM1802 family CRISPR-associated protein [Thiospirillum jenense]MBB1126683.1 CRISPR-associated protein [Thiospirillum jenense]
MLAEMRELALLELNARCNQTGLSLGVIRKQHGEYLTPLLVEDSEKIAIVYLLQAVSEQPGVVKLWSEEITPIKAPKLPFVMSRVAAFGPIMKRTFQNGEPGPTLNTQALTAKSFAERGQQNTQWAAYFREMHNTLFCSQTLVFADQSYSIGAGQIDPHILAAALRLIPEKKTVFLAVLDSTGRWPGECSEYHAYLSQTLANKYITSSAQAYNHANCPLCGATNITLYPNLRGTGINFSNMDRVGAFPNLEIKQAWKSYGLCLDCADLLYVFKNHLLTQQFTGFVAGDRALLLPSLLGNPAGRRHFLIDWQKYINAINDAGNKIGSHENDLLDFVRDRDDAQVVVHILWATFGQVIDDVRGVVTDILPSRLRELTRHNQQANKWQHPLAPRYPLEDATFDLNLTLLLVLLKRPGGKRAAKANESSQLFAIKRQLVEAIYHGVPLGTATAGLWRELLITARWRLDDIADSGNFGGLLYEGYSEKGGKKTYYWTLAGWMKHLARLFYYLDSIGVLPMAELNAEPLQFEPSLAALKPYFQSGSGLNTREKAFTFLLGILYGKVLQVQAARGVNVASNALAWLKRLNLDGRDLPELYCKIREKLLNYGVEANADVRSIVQDLGRLGGQSIGDTIGLDQTVTCYFLLLGQSITVDVLPAKSKTIEE